MNIDLHPIIDNRKRLIVPVSEFSFAAYPVQIKQGFRCLAHAPRSQNTPNKPQWRGWIQQVLNWLRGACGTVVVVPVSKRALLLIFKSAGHWEERRAAGFETCDTADLEVCATAPAAGHSSLEQAIP